MRMRRRFVGLVGLLAVLWLARPTATRRLLSFAVPHVAVVEPVVVDGRAPLPLTPSERDLPRIPPRARLPLARRAVPSAPETPPLPEPDPMIDPTADAPELADPGAVWRPPFTPIPSPLRAPRPAPTSPPIARAPDPHTMTDELRAGMREHDLRVGHALPAAHTIAQALAMSVRRHTPPEARTWFRARLSSDGELLGIEVTSYDPGEGALSRWRDAADDVVAELSSRRFRMPHGSYGSGAVVNIRIDQNLERPSGSGRKRRATPARKKPLERWEWPYNPGPRKAPPIHDRLRPVPIVIGHDAAGTVDIFFPPCIPTLEEACPPEFGAFDLSDIGTHPLRVVHTHVEIEPVVPTHGPRRDALTPHPRAATVE